MYFLGGLPTNYFKILQWLLLTDMILCNCTDTKDSDLKWIVPGSHPNSGKLVLLVGEWWTIDCRVNDEKVNATLWQREIWKRPFKTRRDADGANIQMKNRNVFRLAKLKLSDQGKYYCEACGIKKYAGGIYVNKGVPFAIPSITKVPSTDVSLYGSTVTLECQVKGSYSYYEIKWFKMNSSGRQPLQSQHASTLTQDKTTNIQRQVLKIFNLTEKDEGKYLCQVRRYAVNHIATCTETITVKAKPRLMTTTDTRSRYEKGMQLNCALKKGCPSNVTFNWYSCSGFIRTKDCNEENGWQPLALKNEHLEVKTLERHSILEITGQTTAIKLYRCSVSNEIGMGNLTWEVISNIEKRCPTSVRFALKTNQVVAAWQFSTGCMSCLLLIALIWVYRERRARMKNIAGFQIQKPVATKV